MGANGAAPQPRLRLQRHSQQAAHWPCVQRAAEEQKWESRAAEPQAEEQSWLDTPILDPNEVGGPLEPIKQMVRDNPSSALFIYGSLSLFAFLGTLRLAFAAIDV